MRNVIHYGIPYIDASKIDVHETSIGDWTDWMQTADGEELLSLASGSLMSTKEKQIAALTIQSKKLAEEAIIFGGSHGIYDASRPRVSTTLSTEDC
jgi:hypothetical protein